MDNLNSNMPSVTSTTKKKGKRFVTNVKPSRILVLLRRLKRKKKLKEKLLPRNLIPRPRLPRVVRLKPFLTVQLYRLLSTLSPLLLVLLRLTLPQLLL